MATIPGFPKNTCDDRLAGCYAHECVVTEAVFLSEGWQFFSIAVTPPPEDGGSARIWLAAPPMEYTIKSGDVVTLYDYYPQLVSLGVAVAIQIRDTPPVYYPEML